MKCSLKIFWQWRVILGEKALSGSKPPFWDVIKRHVSKLSCACAGFVEHGCFNATKIFKEMADLAPNVNLKVLDGIWSLVIT